MLAIVAFVLVCLFTGCESAPAPRDQSLDEARIKLAVDAERNRWAAELSETITSRLREADSRIENISDRQRAALEAARSYRQLVLVIIEKLQRTENQRTEAD